MIRPPLAHRFDDVLTFRLGIERRQLAMPVLHCSSCMFLTCTSGVTRRFADRPIFRAWPSAAAAEDIDVAQRPWCLEAV
jgi:hypothetical protein